MANSNWLANELKNLSIWSTTASDVVGGTSVASDVWSSTNGVSWGHSLGTNGRNDASGLGFKVDVPLSTSLENVVACGNALSGGSDFLKPDSQWNGVDAKVQTVSSIGMTVDGMNGSTSLIRNPTEAGWDHVRVRQDTTWDEATIARKLTEQMSRIAVEPSKPSDGTEIWRSALQPGDQPTTLAADKPRMNGHPPMWTDLDRRVALPTDAGHQIFPPPGVSSNSVSWDATAGTRMWGDRSNRIETSLPLPDVLRHLSASGKFAALGSTSSEADFGVWSHSPPAVPPQPQHIDNGTAIWGNPPGIPTTTQTAPARPPAPPVLPFNIDLSVPPPPLPKVPIVPPASAWNASSQMGPMLPGSTKNQNAPQMRSRLLQQLLDMGFRKEDAQNAIIRNNMNMERTIADLLANAVRYKSGADRLPPMLANNSGRFIHSPNSLEGLMQSSAIMRGSGGGVISPPNLPPLGRNLPSPLAIDAAAAGMDVTAQRLLLQQLLAQQAAAGQQQQQQQQVREALAVRQLICDCLQLVTALRELYQLRAVRGRDTDGQITAIIAQVEERVCDKVFGQLMCLPSSALSFDIKELGYENGVAAAVDILKTLQQLKAMAPPTNPLTLSSVNALTPSPVLNGFSPPPSLSGVWSSTATGPTKSSTTPLTSADMSGLTSSGLSPDAGTIKSGMDIKEFVHVKEFVPGRPWLPQTATIATTAPSTGPGSLPSSVGTATTGLGIRRGSLADIDKVTVVNSRLSSSEWSLDCVGVGGAVAGGLKGPGSIDPAASVPALWSPAEPASANGATGSGAMNSALCGGVVANDASGAAALPCTLILKSISDKLDSATLKSLCAGHGRLKSFEMNTDTAQAVVTYAVHADAVHAQRALDMCLFGDCHLVAEFQDANAGGDFVVPGASGSAGTHPALRGAAAVWSSGVYEHGWSLGDEVDSSFLPAGLLNDSC